MSDPLKIKASNEPGMEAAETETALNQNDKDEVDVKTKNEILENDHDVQAVEVVFEPGITSKHRRKVSLTSNKQPSLPSSSCFIHALLEAQKAAEANRDDPSTGVVKNELPGPDGHIASRTMTKLQLTDLALGIKELSKRFASMQIKMQVRNFFLLTKPGDKRLVKYTREIALWLLQNQEHARIYVDKNLEKSKDFDYHGVLALNDGYGDRLKFWTNQMCLEKPQTFDFVITLGGDGTVLYASWLFQKVVPPVLSFSLGSLGFLTKFDYKNFSQILGHALNDGLTISLRPRFEGTVMRSIAREKQEGDLEDRSLTDEILGKDGYDGPTHHPDESFTVLNEIVVDRGPNPTMSSTELFGDDEHLTTVLADGICIATPTGSTAYSLAAGGSLCHPEIPAMLVTPICAHSLTFRPLVLPDSIVLRVGVPYDARTTAWASFDGRQRVELHQGDYITVSASRFPFPTTESRKHNKDWFDSLGHGFNWGARQKQIPLSEWQ